MRFLIFFYFSAIVLICFPQSSSIMDSRDGRINKTVSIGTQIWMAENLNVSIFRNGDQIQGAKSFEQWRKAGENKQPIWCYYDFDSKNEVKSGKLYNWYAVSDPRGLAPKGWHVPTDLEWELVIDFLGGENLAGEKLKSTTDWNVEGN